MSATAYQVHVQAKAAAEAAANCMSRVMNVPPAPPYSGSGDLDAALYWATRAKELIIATDTKLGDLGYPQ